MGSNNGYLVWGDRFHNEEQEALHIGLGLEEESVHIVRQFVLQ